MDQIAQRPCPKLEGQPVFFWWPEADFWLIFTFFEACADNNGQEG
jgi:hypothetical protein